MIYMKTKELGWNETQGIQSIGIEDSQGNRIVDQKQVLKIWENYILSTRWRPVLFTATVSPSIFRRIIVISTSPAAKCVLNMNRNYVKP